MASSLEDKIFFSRMRFIGFAILAPSGLLFFSSILQRWKWLDNVWVWVLLYAPSVGTILITLGVFDQNLLVHSHAAYQYLGVSALTFENGPWFTVHYRWNNIINLLLLILLFYSMIVEKKKRKPIYIISLGAFLGSIVDAYCVATNSPFRWLMLSAGTFVVTEISIWYISEKYDLFGILSADRAERAKLRENMEFQKRLLTLLAHDLSGNIHQQAHLAQFLRKKLQSNHNEILDTWSDSVQASSDLISNIMRWMKTQSDEFRPQLEPIEIQPLIEKCIENVEASFVGRDVKIQLEVPSQSYTVKCDREMMSSIFRNLISNAFKATEDGKQICIRIEELSNQVRISVKDQGAGMTADLVESILRDQSGKRQGAGYGFGLNLVKYFIELHQGKLEISSIQQQGTEVYFSVPL